MNGHVDCAQRRRADGIGVRAVADGQARDAAGDFAASSAVLEGEGEDGELVVKCQRGQVCAIRPSARVRAVVQIAGEAGQRAVL